MLNKILFKLTNKHFLSLAGNGAMAVLSIVTYSLLYRMLTEVEMVERNILGAYGFYLWLFMSCNEIENNA